VHFSSKKVKKSDVEYLLIFDEEKKLGEESE